jgi:hypothetical protein
MRRLDITKLTTPQLLDRFTEIGEAQYVALLDDDHRKYNRLYDLMNDVDKELRARGRTTRLELLKLFDHPNDQVRLKAATHALGVAPARARQALEDLASDVAYPQTGDARSLLRALNEGTFKPT